MVAVITIALLVGISLLRYAIDLLAIGLFVWVVGRTTERVLDWFAGDDVSGWSLAAIAPTAVAAVLLLEWVGGPPFLLPHVQRHVPAPVTRALDWAADRGWGQQVVLHRDPPTYEVASWDDRDPPHHASSPGPAGIDWSSPSVPPGAFPPLGGPALQVESEAEAAGVTGDGRVMTATRLEVSPSAPPGVVTRLRATVTARSGETPRGSVEFRIERRAAEQRLPDPELDAAPRRELAAHFKAEPPFADSTSPPLEPADSRD